jgi:DNA modification methylase
MTEPYYADASVTVYAGDCLDILGELGDASVDAVVADPPYNLSFMSKAWDRVSGESIDPAFMHWLAGFIDGEGCFHVHKKPQSTYDCQFTITLRADDRPVLERIQRTLRMGTLSKPTAHRTGPDNPKARYNITRKADLVRFRDLLRAFPLRAKKAVDFEVWSDALDAWVGHEIGEWREMAELRDELMQGRAYKEEGIRIDPFQMWCWRWSRECLRVLKPGGHMLAFGGTRTSHRLACAIEDAGFEIRDSIAWLYGSGFPKSLDVSKAIDRAAGAEREVVGANPRANQQTPKTATTVLGDFAGVGPVTAPTTDDARTWQGWGTALKPGWEIVIRAQKPRSIEARIGSHLETLEGSCRPPANDAAGCSAPIHHGSRAAMTATAPANAATQLGGALANQTATGAAAGSSDQTAMSPSGSETTTCSNIVTSWKRCLVALCEPTSTSTTKTTSGTTTDLTTLWSCLSKITGPSTLLDVTKPDGLSSRARVVDDLFAAAVLSLNATRTLTAIEPVTSPTVQHSPDEAALSQVVVARKPLTGTVAANVLAHGTGALNVDGCRVGVKGGGGNGLGSHFDRLGDTELRVKHGDDLGGTVGRWPANVVLDVDQAAALDAQSGERTSGNRAAGRYGLMGYMGANEADMPEVVGDSGGASRFFYTAKAPTSERIRHDGTAHPTVKPLDLMRWLVRLVTPPGGLVLDPFAGSGTTAEACLLEGFRCVTIEREADYLPLIVQRINRRRDPVAYLETAGEDLGLFDFEEPA